MSPELSPAGTAETGTTPDSEYPPVVWKRASIDVGHE